MLSCLAVYFETTDDYDSNCFELANRRRFKLTPQEPAGWHALENSSFWVCMPGAHYVSKS